MPAPKQHTRINDILLGPLERPVLRWFSRVMPAWVKPDHLTSLGILGSVIIFAAYWLTHIDRGFLWLASFGFFLNWFGDSMDGTLARYRNIQRPIYGFFIDHSTDSISMLLVFLGLGLSPYVQFSYACLGLIGYLLMSIMVYLSTIVKGEFKISYAKIGPTEMRVIAVLANTLIFFIGNPAIRFPWGGLQLYDLIAILIALLLFSFFLISTFRQASVLAKIDVPGSARKES